MPRHKRLPAGIFDAADPLAPTTGRRAVRPAPRAAGGRPRAPDLADAADLERLTVYLRRAQASGLRRLALDRRDQGTRADVSMLLREAADLLLGAGRARRGRAA